MKLKRIELKGFKSFAKEERLEFERRITAIVGPNGSGKSNIAEAFRFVLGEQSMKSLRSKKTEDLLFNGSSSLQRVNRASVALAFDNTEREIQRAFDEIEIKRVIYRDGTNEYYINGSVVRLKDIVEMLAQAKIGIAGHNIISQGEADKLLSMGARERKAYIEEALGLTQYQHKKKDALRKLEKTEENLVSIRSLLRELIPHVRYLEREMKQIEKRKELVNELERRGREYVRIFRPFITKERLAKEHEHAKTLERLSRLAPVETGGETRKEYEDERTALRRELERVSASWDALRREQGELERLVGRIEAKIEIVLERVSKKDSPLTDTDAAERLLRVRNLLESALHAQHIEHMRDAIKEALEITRAQADSNEHVLSEGDKEEEAKLREELVRLSRETEERALKERELFHTKGEIERKISDLFQREQRDASEAEKITIERSSLEMVRASQAREIESLKQEEAYFYASIEEMTILTGRRIVDESGEGAPEREYTRSELRAMEHGLERLKLKIEGMQTGDSKHVETEFRSAKEREAFLEKEIRDLEETSGKLRGIIEELEKKIEIEFGEGMSKISGLFSMFFAQMFAGGTAGLELVTLRQTADEEEDGADEKDEAEQGVEIVLTMPHKKLRSITMLSGGEKTLVSIALVFALAEVNPPPFIVLDETDATLDESNSRRYGEALKALSKYSQLILITHNRETMSRAGMLYGVTMGRASSSELLSIDLEEAEKIAH
jgi:chromosome segregation protein